MKRINKVVIEYDLDEVLQGVNMMKDERRTVREVMESEKVHDVYVKQYPTDEMGQQINPSVTFLDLLEGMRNRQHPCDIMEVEDSIIRERVFGELSKRMHVPYEVIYRLWLPARLAM